MDEVEDFLAHYGVKGMRWGVRKKGERSSEPAKPSKRRIALEGKYIKEGKSLEEAKQLADGRLKTEKILAVVGGVALAAVVGYVAKEEAGKRFSSVVLDQGTELKYINALGDKVDLDRRLYTTFSEKDTRKYKGLLAKQLKANAPNTKVYETVLTAKEKIKAPSHNQASKVFKEMQKKSASFAIDTKGMNYKQFNQLLVDDDWSPGKKFYGELSKRGFNAVLDSNDQFLSGYNTKKPLILFNAASTTVKTGQKVVDDNIINGLYKKQLAGVIGKQFVPQVGLGAAALGGSIAIDSKTKHTAVNRYIVKNPNSKEDPAEIFSRLEKTPAGNYVVRPKR